MIKNNVCTRMVNCLCVRGLYWCLFPEFRNNEGNKHQNNTQVRAETVRNESTCIIYFIHDITNR